MNINDLLKIAVEAGASDLHLKVGNPPVVRVDGRLEPLTNMKRLMQEDTSAIALSIMNGRQKQRFKEEYEIDLSYEVSGLGRFRCAIFQQRGAVGMVLRVIPTKIFTLNDLNLPAVLEKICEEPRGLVLCTGTTGSGKSTTLAAMIDHINTKRGEHVVTIEDPIEYVHRDKKSLIPQRELDVDTRSFATALRASLRQDPDVILVGEMRDLETVATALTAAETGHLILSTLHTSDVASAIHRIVDVFPASQQTQIKQQLALSLNAIVVQQLMPRSDGTGSVVAVELLLATYAVRNQIRNDKLQNLSQEITLGKRNGTMTIEDSLVRLVQDGLITLDEARVRATRPDELESLLRVR
jgi:twitching motility protein PilT